MYYKESINGAVHSPRFCLIMLPIEPRATHVLGHPDVHWSPSVNVTDLEFAAKTAVFGDFPDTMQAIFDRGEFCAAKVGLSSSTKKTKVLSAFALPGAQQLFVIYERLVICYHSDTCDRFFKCGSGLCAQSIVPTSTSTAGILWNCATVRPVPTYGCKAWSLQAEEMRRPGVFNH